MKDDKKREAIKEWSALRAQEYHRTACPCRDRPWSATCPGCGYGRGEKR